jgi:predicted dehydrogenase
VLFEISIHELDWIMALGGALQSVYGQKLAVRSDYQRANDHVWCTLSFQSGAVGTLEGSSVSHASAYDRGVLGSEGALVTTDWGRRLAYCEGGKQQGEMELDERFDLRAHFLDCIEQGAAPVADAEWGLQVIRAADAIIQSAVTGRAVEL